MLVRRRRSEYLCEVVIEVGDDQQAILCEAVVHEPGVDVDRVNMLAIRKRADG